MDTFVIFVLAPLLLWLFTLSVLVVINSFIGEIKHGDGVIVNKYFIPNLPADYTKISNDYEYYLEIAIDGEVAGSIQVNEHYWKAVKIGSIKKCRYSNGLFKKSLYIKSVHD